ncbi:SCP2 domain-containing protein [Marinibactrum halimedae]|uniref:Ubiquinone biosynthesis accessory factor UbiJ n=1 Tax=Marinibactrum halimedae TaxID=1444977 RepID=A0AA37WLC0_9GAMM|nr:hypothetical protein [Marinibactrum halimedae]MCD9459290.1 hypothetical protein [Marinibactrum halimedae]GLS25819.1 hypothetical protein GCM10007877_15330 [Marinibactrum halimedae]
MTSRLFDQLQSLGETLVALGPTAQAGLSSALEATLNKALQYDPSSRYQLPELTDHILCIELDKPHLSFFLHTDGEQVLIRNHWENSAAILKGPLSAFIGLALNDQSNLHDSGIQFLGNTSSLLKWRVFFQQLDIDWEDALNDVLGDLTGHQIAQGIRAGTTWLSNRLSDSKRQVEEFIVEELRSTPSRFEFDDFADQVDELRMEADRLQAKLAHFIQQRSQQHTPQQHQHAYQKDQGPQPTDTSDDQDL